MLGINTDSSHSTQGNPDWYLCTSLQNSCQVIVQYLSIIMFQVSGLDENNVQNGNVSAFKSKEEKQQEESDVKYGIDTVPSWYLCILMGLQVIRMYRVWPKCPWPTTRDETKSQNH
jgi:hypothetical protein